MKIKNELLGERITAIREEKKIPSHKLIKDLGLPRSTYYSWLKGTHGIDIDQLKKIADYLGTTPEYILGETKFRGPQKHVDLKEILESEDEICTWGEDAIDEEFIEVVKDLFKKMMAKK